MADFADDLPPTGRTLQPDQSSDDFSQGLPPTGLAKPQPEPVPVYHGAIVPFSRDSAGNVYFDPWNAGPIGSIKQAFTLPGRVASGEVQMPSTFDPAVNDPRAKQVMGEAINFANTFGGVNPMVRSGDRAIPGIRMAPKDMTLAKTPTGPELVDKGVSQINAYRNMAIPYNPGYMGTLANQVEQKLVDKGIYPEDSPGLYTTIRRLHDFAPRSDDPTATIALGPNNLISIRKNIANKFGNLAENQEGVGTAFDAINGLIENPPSEAILAGPPTAGQAVRYGAPAARSDLDNQLAATLGGRLYKMGRENASAGYRDADLAAIQREANLRSRSANSGQNFDNSLRSRITSAVLNAKRLKAFTPEEVEKLEAVPEGSIPTNAARFTGNLLGGGGGFTGAVTGALGTAAGQFAGAGDLSWLLGPMVPAAGNALKRLAGKSTNEALDEVRQATRQRSPMFQQSLPGQDLYPNVDLRRDAMARTLARMFASPGGMPAVQDETLAPPWPGDEPPPRLYISPNRDTEERT